MLSAPGFEGNEGHPLWPAEQAVMSSAPQWTVVRPNWFAQAFGEAFWRAGILAGSLALPTGDGATPFVDADDIADVATAALTDDGHHGRSYVLTGPRAVTFGEATALIAEATGRPVRHVDITPGDFTRDRQSAGTAAADRGAGGTRLDPYGYPHPSMLAGGCGRHGAVSIQRSRANPSRRSWRTRRGCSTPRWSPVRRTPARRPG